jgi:signal transduction histidine kinase
VVCWQRDLIVMSATATLSLAILAGQASSGESVWFLALDIAVGVVATALVPVTLRHPALGSVLLAPLAALSPTATAQANLSVLYVARWRRFPVAIAAATLGVAAQAVQGLWRPHGGMAWGWWLVLIAATYAAVVGWGAWYRANQALVESLRERARQAEAEQGRRVAEARLQERTRIAREMHDVLAHRLSLLATYAGALEYRPDSPPEKIAKAVTVVRDSADQALVDLREVINVLREEDGDLAPPGDIPRLLEESRAAGVDVYIVDDVAAMRTLPPAAGRTAYRVVQEAMTNARRHAPGSPVTVEMRGAAGDGLTIEVRNALSDPAAPSTGNGTGLIGLVERVHLVGGRLDHEVGGGEFRLRAWLPWPA